MGVNVKIISVNNNWATIRYSHSSARSRIKTDQLAKDYENGTLNVQNEDLLAPFMDEE